MKIPFSAVLLAGGKSSRMGQDKCLMEIENKPIWKRQWELLQELTPDEIMASARADQSYFLAAGVRVVVDAFPAQGPLGGLATVLTTAAHDLVLVIAVDMVGLQAPPLHQLLGRSSAQAGAVFVHDDCFEPLAAVYPRRLASSATAAISRGELRMQDWLSQSVSDGDMQACALPDRWQPQFKNLNSPEDWKRWKLGELAE